MKVISYLHPAVYAGKTKGMGRGMFSMEKLEAGTLIETAPVIVMDQNDRIHLDKTLLHDYIFEWGQDQKQCCMALGYIALYNHSFDANCEYEMDFKKQIISIKTVKPVKKGAELFINYNGDADNKKPLWFKAE